VSLKFRAGLSRSAIVLRSTTLSMRCWPKGCADWQAAFETRPAICLLRSSSKPWARSLELVRCCIPCSVQPVTEYPQLNLFPLSAFADAFMDQSSVRSWVLGEEMEKGIRAKG
jgi:hypothetical protein